MSATTCPLLEDPVNGHVSVTALTVQSTATYSCNLGYVLIGEGNRMCEEGGAWSNEEPTCESKYTSYPVCFHSCPLEAKCLYTYLRLNRSQYKQTHSCCTHAFRTNLVEH